MSVLDQSTCENLRIRLCGNPFVDTGLAVIAARSELDSIDELTLKHLKAIHNDGEWLAKEVQELKCFTMIFTRNALLTQYPKNDKKGLKERRVKMHAAITTELLKTIGNETIDEYCEACGNDKTTDLSSLVNHALSKFDEEPRERFVGRDWFPLAGSMGSDAQAMQSASKAPRLCAKCLFAVQYLPLGVRLFGRELAVFQCTNSQFWYALVRGIARAIREQISNGLRTIYGSKEGRRGLAKQLLDVFTDMQTKMHLQVLPKDTRLYAWRFANSTAPNIEIDEIPNHALQFLWKAAHELDLNQEIRKMLTQERLSEDRSFFTSIVRRTDYSGLYPGRMGKEREYEGASPSLFFLYQTEVVGRSSECLRAANQVAQACLKLLKESNVKGDTLKTRTQSRIVNERTTRREAFHDPKTRSMFKKVMLNEARYGGFGLDQYSEIFPYSSSGVTVSFEGWDVIRYYFGRAARQTPIEISGTKPSSKSPNFHTLQNVKFYAAQIYYLYERKWGLERFERDILSLSYTGKMSIGWLRAQFLALARTSEGFSYSEWKSLCYGEQGKPTIYELMFQFRLLWSEWLRNRYEGRTLCADFKWQNWTSGSQHALPDKVAECLRNELIQSIQSRGLQRTEKVILDRLRNHEMGLWWFASKLTCKGSGPFTSDEMQDFLTNKDGEPQIAEKVFQMSLFLSNIYRTMNG